MTRTARRGDAGFSFVELMVAIVAFSIVGGIVTAALVSQNSNTRDATVSATTQEQLVDAMTHLSRDLGNSSVIAVASSNALQTRGLVDGRCVVSDYTASGTSLTERQTTLAETSCPTTGGTSDGSTPVTKTIVNGLSTTGVFTYFDDNNATTADPASVRLVRYALSAQVAGRSRPLVATSAVTIQRVHS